MSPDVSWSQAETPLGGFLSVVTDEATYRNLVYLVISVLLGGIYAVGLGGGFLVGITFAPILVGIPIIIVTIVLGRWGSALERALLVRLVGVQLSSPRDVDPYERGATPKWFKQVLTAPSTWKGIGFLVIKVFVGFVGSLLLLMFGLVIASLLTAPITRELILLGFWRIDTLWESVLVMPLGALLLLVFMHVVNWIATICTHLGRALLQGTHAAS